MDYNATRQMVESDSLLKRVTAAAAGESIINPEQWAKDQIWYLASNSEWVEGWVYAKNVETLENNPDTGARPGVISDSAILGAVQARKAALDAAEPEPPSSQI